MCKDNSLPPFYTTLFQAASRVHAAVLVEADVPVVLLRAAESLTDSEEALALCEGGWEAGVFASAHGGINLGLKKSNSCA